MGTCNSECYSLLKLKYLSKSKNSKSNNELEN